MKPKCDPVDFTASNAAMLDVLRGSENGRVKQASEGSSDYIKTFQMERGWARSIQPPVTPGAERLRTYPDNENMDIMDEKQPGSPAAGTLNMNSAPEIHIFYGDRFLTRFFDITTRKHMKNLRNLEVYKYDLRQIVTDQAMNQIEVLEDTLYKSLTEAICGDVADFELGMTEQNVNFPTAQGGISTVNYNNALNLFNDDTTQPNVALINKTTWSQFATFPATSVGGPLAEKLFKEGIAGLGSSIVLGVKHLITIKSDIIANGVVFLYTEPNFLGKFYVLREPQMYVDKKDDMISFYAKETIGFSIANTAGVRKITFETIRMDLTLNNELPA